MRRGLVLAGVLGLGLVAVAGVSMGKIPGRASSSLEDLDPFFRARWDQLDQALRELGHEPTVRETWRDLVRQAYYVREGWSQVSQSFHTVTRAGVPASLAVDVHDRRWPANDERQAPFYQALRQLAPRWELRTGGEFSQSDPTWAKFGLGWDPGHVEPARGLVTTAAANAGARPWEA